MFCLIHYEFHSAEKGDLKIVSRICQALHHYYVFGGLFKKENIFLLKNLFLAFIPAKTRGLFRMKNQLFIERL